MGMTFSIYLIIIINMQPFPQNARIETRRSKYLLRATIYYTPLVPLCLRVPPCFRLSHNNAPSNCASWSGWPKRRQPHMQIFSLLWVFEPYLSVSYRTTSLKNLLKNYRLPRLKSNFFGMSPLDFGGLLKGEPFDCWNCPFEHILSYI